MTIAFRPTKPRSHGSLHLALTNAINEVGGLAAAGELIHRGENWLYTAADPDVERRKEARLSYEDARTLSRAGATSLAEDLSLLAGGAFLPPLPDTAPHALQLAVAAYAAESGEVLAEIIRRAADGDFSPQDATVSLKEIDEALRALMGIRAITVETASGSRPSSRERQSYRRPTPRASSPELEAAT